MRVTEEEYRNMVRGSNRRAGHIGDTAEREKPLPVARPAPAPSPYDSKLEEQYAQILEYEKRTGEIKDWLHHPGSFPLGTGKRYRPDFLVWRADLSIEMIEVKGWHKNKRDSDTHVAWFAQRFKCFTVRRVWKEDGRWNGKYITA